jgi:ubiquinone/menaquinone biosynthesis C-methylase UbiE
VNELSRKWVALVLARYVLASPQSYDPEGFNSYERSGWEVVPVAYREGFGSLTIQAIEPLLDAVGAGPGVRLLDVACGPGWVSAAAAGRGASVVGVDMSSAMLAEARRLHPGLELQVGDAESLPFPDRSFDAVVMNFGLLHVGRPEQALTEAHRVLRPGGRFAFTVWAVPEQSVGFALTLRAVEAHGRLDVGLPAGPPFFRFSDPEEARRTLATAGFESPRVSTLPQVWQLPAAGALFDIMVEGTVRTRALLRAQSPAALAAIRAAMTEGARAYAKDGHIELPMPAILAVATKALAT